MKWSWLQLLEGGAPLSSPLGSIILPACPRSGGEWGALGEQRVLTLGTSGRK